MTSRSLLYLFLRLANASVDNLYVSRWVHRSEFIGEYASLQLGNGGSWCRLDNSGIARNFKLVTVKGSKKICYSWEATDDEKSTLEQQIPPITAEDRPNSIVYIKVCGKKEEGAQYSRVIRSDIRQHYGSQPCVVCGTTTNVEVDHKNGLYNNPAVLSVDTQTMDDFQSLCKHCNDKKRETIKTMRMTGVRHSALTIPQLAVFGVAYTEGGEDWDLDDPHAMVGTYWYDPVDFMNSVLKNTERR